MPWLMADMGTVTTNKAAESKKTTKNIGLGLGVHLNNYTDHGNILGDVAGNAANAGVGSTTSFAGVAVAAEGWLATIDHP
jgi:hypothetical protein